MGESFEAFAHRLGCSRQYVAKLAKQGCLVLDAAGKVLPQESLIRMREMGVGERRPDVKARNAAAKGQTTPGLPVAACDEEVAAKNDPEELPLVGSTFRRRMIAAQNRRMKLEIDLKVGKRVYVDDAKAAAMACGSALATLMERIPDRLAPLFVTTTDTDDRRSLIEAELREVEREIKRLLPRLLREMRRKAKGE